MQAVRIRARERVFDELAVIAQRAQAFTNASGAAIALSEGNTEEIVCRARAGSSAPELGTVLRVEGTFTGLCIQRGRELRCDDTETDPRVDKAAIRALGIRSIVAIPIKGEGRVVGVLAVFAHTAHAFKITHVVVLTAMADQIAAYLQREQHEEPYSPAPLPAPLAKPIAASAEASPLAPPVVVIKPVEPPSTQRQIPVVPKVEAVRAGISVEEIDQVPFSKEKKTNSRDKQPASKTPLGGTFRTLDAAAARENRSVANVLMIGAAAVVVIAVVAGLLFKLRGPAATSQPPLETPSSPSALAAPPLASVNVQPPAKNSPPLAPDKDEGQPRRVATVMLSARPSRIPRARDNAVPASDAPAISLASVPASGSLPNLVSSVPQPSHPRFVTQSKLEPVTVIKRVPPVYPAVAKQQRLSASVVVQGTVNKNGRLSDLQLISGPPLFRDAAFAAAKQWVFKPARLNGQAIEQPTRIRLDFAAQ